MTAEQGMERINTVLAHAWMVRTFLKHADEIQEDEEMLEVHRMIFDYVRALEPSYERKDAKEYLHRAKGKLPKLRRVTEFFVGGQAFLSVALKQSPQRSQIESSESGGLRMFLLPQQGNGFVAAPQRVQG